MRAADDLGAVEVGHGAGDAEHLVVRPRGKPEVGHRGPQELGGRRLTTLLVEGGPTVLAGMFAADQVDEAWVFVAPRILGGAAVAVEPPAADVRLRIEEVTFPGGDVLVRGTLR